MPVLGSTEVHSGRSIGRGAQRVGGQAGLDEHVALVGEAVGRGQRALPVHQRQPGAAAVVVEAGDVERALVQRAAAAGEHRRVGPALTNL
jgi:hypothetical protein